MQFFARIGSCVLAVAVAAGCASTEMSDRQRLVHEKLPRPNHIWMYDFASDGLGMGKGVVGTISVNGQKVAEGWIEHTQCCAFSADEGTDVGMDEGTSVTEEYKEHDNRFTGTIQKVTIDLKDMKTANAEEEQRVIHEAHVRKQLAD